MADPIQTARIVEAMLHAIVPGGAEVWAWLPADDAWTPSETARSVMEAALSTAYPMIKEEMARVCDALAANPDWQSPIARETARCAFEEAAETIRATELAKGEE